MTAMRTNTSGVTPASWTWDVVPPEGWFVVPPAGSVTAEDLSAWETAATALVRESLEPGTSSDQEGQAELGEALAAELDTTAAQAVANLREFADGVSDGGHRVVAVAGLMDRSPIPVLVTVGISDPAAPDEDLMAALGATGGLPVSPPKVEYPDLPDGDGVRVTRIDLGEVSGGAWVSVSLGRRTEHPDAVVDTVLVWRSQDIFLGAAMTEALDELLPTVQINPVQITPRADQPER